MAALKPSLSIITEIVKILGLGPVADEAESDRPYMTT